MWLLRYACLSSHRRRAAGSTDPPSAPPSRETAPWNHTKVTIAYLSKIFKSTIFMRHGPISYLIYKKQTAAPRLSSAYLTDSTSSSPLPQPLRGRHLVSRRGSRIASSIPIAIRVFFQNHLFFAVARNRQRGEIKVMKKCAFSLLLTCWLPLRSCLPPGIKILAWLKYSVTRPASIKKFPGPL